MLPTGGAGPCVLLLALMPAALAFAPMAAPLGARGCVVALRGAATNPTCRPLLRKARPGAQMATAAAAQETEAAGTVEHDPVVNNLVTIRYTPAKGMFAEGAQLKYLGSMNGWDAETEPPCKFTMTLGGSGVYGVVVKGSDYALELDFLVTDGVKFDTNNGEFFHIPLVEGEDAQRAVYEKHGINIKFFDDGVLLGETLALPQEKLAAVARRANVDLGTEDPMFFTKTFKSKVPKDYAKIPVARSVVNRGMVFPSMVTEKLLSNAPIPKRLEQFLTSTDVLSGSGASQARAEYTVFVGKKVALQDTNQDMATERRMLGRWL